MSSNERRNKPNRSYGQGNYRTEEEIRKINQMNANLKGEVIQISSTAILVLTKEYASYYSRDSEREANVIKVGIDDYIRVNFFVIFFYK